MTTSRRLLSVLALLCVAMIAVHTLPAQDAAADSQADGVTKGPVTTEKPDPLKRPLSDREKIEQRKALKQELKEEYKKWADERRSGGQERQKKRMT